MSFWQIIGIILLVIIGVFLMGFLGFIGDERIKKNADKKEAEKRKEEKIRAIEEASRFHPTPGDHWSYPFA